MTQYLLIALGGAVGAIARYAVALWIQQRTTSSFPFGTFVVNVSGCFVMGIVMTLLTERLTVSANWRFLIPVGFIGAYTTFSSFELETFRAIEQGNWLTAFSYVVTSLVFGFAALWLGVIATRQVL